MQLTLGALPALLSPFFLVACGEEDALSAFDPDSTPVEQVELGSFEAWFGERGGHTAQFTAADPAHIRYGASVSGGSETGELLVAMEVREGFTRWSVSVHVEDWSTRAPLAIYFTADRAQLEDRDVGVLLCAEDWPNLGQGGGWDWCRELDAEVWVLFDEVGRPTLEFFAEDTTGGWDVRGFGLVDEGTLAAHPVEGQGGTSFFFGPDVAVGPLPL